MIDIEKSGDKIRLLYDTKGRFILHKISPEEAKYKLCRVNGSGTQAKMVPYLITHDGRTLRYPDPLIKVNDTVKLDIETGKVVDFVKFEAGNTAIITKGGNTGRVGTVQHVEKHPGSFDIVTIKDVEGNVFATRLTNVFVIGKGGELKDALISLPRGKGVKVSRSRFCLVCVSLHAYPPSLPICRGTSSNKGIGNQTRHNRVLDSCLVVRLP